MIEKKIKITNPNGLHTRPAKRLVDLSKGFDSDIVLLKGEKEGSAKNLIKLMKLGIACGSDVVVRCSGSDEEKACTAAVQLLTTMAD